MRAATYREFTAAYAGPAPGYPGPVVAAAEAWSAALVARWGEDHWWQPPCAPLVTASAGALA
eukprot:3917286-Alexandrium_andersonii.AAC.2